MKKLFLRKSGFALCAATVLSLAFLGAGCKGPASTDTEIGSGGNSSGNNGKDDTTGKDDTSSGGETSGKDDTTGKDDDVWDQLPIILITPNNVYDFDFTHYNNSEKVYRIKITGNYKTLKSFWEQTLLLNFSVYLDLSEMEMDKIYKYYRNDHLQPRAILLPKTLKVIGDEAFYNYTYIKSITIPDGVEEIGKYAFYACTSLESVTIPNSVKKIGSSAFSSNKKLKSITIPDGVEKIESKTFAYCSGLESVYVDAEQISSYAFTNCYWLTNVVIGKNVMKISKDSFSGCVVTSVEFEDTENWIYETSKDKIDVTDPKKNAELLKDLDSDLIKIK